jgi:hypothetical protein
MHSKRSSVLCLAFAACGGGGSPAREVEEPEDRTSKAYHSSEEEEPEDGLELESTRGKMSEDDITAGIEPVAGELQECFLSQVGKKKWLGGRVEIKWEVAGDGALTSAQIATSDLGAWPVEKCLLDLSRAMTFAAPQGEKAADFTVPFDFDGARPASWWDEDKAAAVLKRHTATLDECAATAKSADPTDVSVTLYLGTRGKVQSVGFASPALIDDAWAACAEKTVMGWTLSDPKGSVVKLGFVYRQGETPVAEEED